MNKLHIYGFIFDERPNLQCHFGKKNQIWKRKSRFILNLDYNPGYSFFVHVHQSLFSSCLVLKLKCTPNEYLLMPKMSHAVNSEKLQ